MNASETRECPFCAETIKAAAQGCRFCGYVFPVEGEAVAAAPVPARPPSTALAQEELSNLLSGLVEKSLILYEEDVQGRGRYRLLETVRQYSRDRLLESGETVDVRGRHLGRFVDWQRGPSRTCGAGSNWNGSICWKASTITCVRL